METHLNWVCIWAMVYSNNSERHLPDSCTQLLFVCITCWSLHVTIFIPQKWWFRYARRCPDVAWIQQGHGFCTYEVNYWTRYVAHFEVSMHEGMQQRDGYCKSILQNSVWGLDLSVDSWEWNNGSACAWAWPSDGLDTSKWYLHFSRNCWTIPMAFPIHNVDLHKPSDGHFQDIFSEDMQVFTSGLDC